MTESLRHAAYEAKFKAFGVTFTLDPDVPLDSIRITEKTQVRSASQLAPQDQVNLYAIQMAAGEVFPPVVIWNNLLLDGNTRLHAERKAGHASTAAYRVECRNEDHAKDLAAAINQTNGRRLNPEEARNRAVSMLDSGYSDAFIARELGMEATKVRRWRREEDARLHAERLDLATPFSTISATNRAKLADISHDGPFKAIVTALSTYDVPSRDFNEMVEATRKASSDDEAIKLVEERTENYEPRGTRRYGRGPKVTAREAYRGIGMLTNHPVSYWVDLTEKETAVEKWQSLVKLAQGVLQAYGVEGQVAV